MLRNLFISIIFAIFFNGCFSVSSINPFSSEAEKEEIQEIEIPQNAPSWVSNPKEKGFITAVGIAKDIDKKDLHFHKQKALIHAGHQLTKDIFIKTVNFYKGYEEKLENPKTYDKDIKKFAEHISLKSLTHSRITDTLMSLENKLLFIKIAVDSEIVATQIQNTSKLLFDVDKKLYQNFLSNRAYKNITIDLEK